MHRRDGNVTIRYIYADRISLGFGRPKTVKRKKDDSSDEYVKQSQKRLRRSSSWKSWYIEQGKDN
jgi:hypothetical protein